MYLTPEELARFEANINYNGKQTPYVDTPCHEWTGRLHMGYGSFYVRVMPGRKSVNRAYLIAKMHYHGFVPDPDAPRGFEECLHMCHNRCCCNADHIEIGSHQKNIIDSVLIGNSSKIPPEVAQELKYEIFSQERKGFAWIKPLAEKYNTTGNIVLDIKKERSWWFLPKYRD